MSPAFSQKMDSGGRSFRSSHYALVILWALSVVVFHQLLELQGMPFSQNKDDITIEYLSMMLAQQQLLRHPVLDLKRGQAAKAVAMPSVRVEEEIESTDRKNFYGGKGDKEHLGGFVSGNVDMDGVSPSAWKVMLTEHGIKSVLDVGCGRGVSTSWFQMHGVKTQCVEGSHDAWEQSLFPNDMRVEHDFSRGYVIFKVEFRFV
jgi:hypothetical protein